MTVFFFATLTGTLLGFLMGFLSFMLILLVLVQRGRGGGLAGALGGPGGQSAFGSKAGDTFTVITVVMAAVWGFTCAFTMWLLGTHAPTITADDNVAGISAGPGDGESTSGVIIPPTSPDAGSSAGSSLSSGETPSMLIPAKKDDAAETGSSEEVDAKADDKEPAVDKEPAAEETPAAEDKPEPEAADKSESTDKKEDDK